MMLHTNIKLNALGLAVSDKKIFKVFEQTWYRSCGFRKEDFVRHPYISLCIICECLAGPISIICECLAGPILAPVA